MLQYLVPGTATGRATWSMYDDRDREVVIKEKHAIKAKREAEAKAKAKKIIPVRTTTKQPPVDEESVDAVEG